MDYKIYLLLSLIFIAVEVGGQKKATTTPSVYKMRLVGRYYFMSTSFPVTGWYDFTKMFDNPQRISSGAVRGTNITDKKSINQILSLISELQKGNFQEEEQANIYIRTYAKANLGYLKAKVIA